MNHIYWLRHHTDERWAYVQGLFTPAQCEIIQLLGNNPLTSQPAVAGVGTGEANPAIRQSQISWLCSDSAETQWVYDRLQPALTQVNTEYFGYDLQYIEALQYSEYPAGQGFYTAHADMQYETVGTRKLSFSVQLSDPDSYQGGDLRMHDGAVLPRQQGTLLVFPSWAVHEVTPVTQGTRASLVGWIVGPRWR